MNTIRHGLRAVITMLLATCAVQTAAQPEPPLSELLLPKNAVTVVDSPFGRAEVGSFADALQASANAACRESRKLGAEQYPTQARALFIHYFPNVRKHIAERMVSEGFKIGFEQAFGQGSLAEWRGLVKSPAMRKRLTILEPRMAEWIIMEMEEKIRQTDVIAGRAIKKSFGVLETGDPELQKIQEKSYDDMDAKLKVLDRPQKSKQAGRFDNMFEGVLTAALGAYKNEPKSSPWLNTAPKDIIADLPARLEAVCVKR